MQIIDTSLDLDADAADVWQVWADVDSWPQWDPHEESARIITEFATGGRAYSKPAGAPGGEFTLVEVTPHTRWVSESSLPLGRMRAEHTVEPLGAGRCRVRIHTTATGVGALLVNLGWGRMMRRDAVLTLRALGLRAKGRA